MEAISALAAAVEEAYMRSDVQISETGDFIAEAAKGILEISYNDVETVNAERIFVRI